LGCSEGKKCDAVKVVSDEDFKKMFKSDSDFTKNWMIIAHAHEGAAILEYQELEERLRAEGNLDDAEAVEEIRVDEVSHKEKLEAMMEAM
jgi:hypothetical protein